MSDGQNTAAVASAVDSAVNTGLADAAAAASQVGAAANAMASAAQTHIAAAATSEAHAFAHMISAKIHKVRAGIHTLDDQAVAAIESMLTAIHKAL